MTVGFLKIRPAEAFVETIYIRADGSIEPLTAPIQRNGDIYTLAADIASSSDGMQVEKDNIVIDGNGYTLQGIGNYFDGIKLIQDENVTVQNMKIKLFSNGILLDSSSNITIRGNKIASNLDGVRLDYFSCYSTISGNNITANRDYGVVLYSHCNYNSFSGNDITDNMYGITLSLYSSNNSFSGNNIRANSYEGIYLMSDCTFNSFRENRITYSYEGIALETSSNYNSFSGNDITDNMYGVRINCASQNSFYFNRFFDNSHQVIFDTPRYVNVWDNGYPAGGNYWSDYPGVDLYCGVFQNETGGDGIDDAPYVIDGSNQDRYPFIVHNVAVTDVSASARLIYEGASLGIKVTAANLGDLTETLRIAVYINETEIETQEATLSSRHSTTVVFTWNTTGFAKGHYTIRAAIDAVPDEIFTVDNSLTGQTVPVATIDLNADKVVNIIDVAIVAKQFGRPPPPIEDLRADVNMDGNVDILDLVIVAIHFGETIG